MPLLPPSSSATPPRRFHTLMPRYSSAPPEGAAAAADPSPCRETEGAPLQSADPGSEDGGGDDLVLDSGAAVHATARADLLSDPRPPDDVTVVRTRVGRDLAVHAVGCIRKPRFVVPQVHHAPGLKNGSVTVISVRQLARRGLAVTFGAGACSVKEQSTGAVVGEGRLSEEDGLYHLDYLSVPQS